MRVLCLVALFCLASGLFMEQPENRELMEKPKKHKKKDGDHQKPHHKKHGHKKYEEMTLDEKMAHGYVLGTMPEHHAKDGDKPVRQRLKSDEGMAYYGTMHVGGQPQVSIYDTGSFDIVLTSSCSDDEEKRIAKAKKQLMKKSSSSTSSFDVGAGDSFGGNMSSSFGLKKGEGDASGPFDDIFGSLGNQDPKLTDPKVLTCCPKDTCPHAGYSTVKSGLNYEEEKDVKLGKITYGSGPVTTRHGTDHVELQDDLMNGEKGKFMFQAISGSKVPVEKIVDHEIDLFKETEMQAIVGIGPGNFKDRKKRMISHLGVKRFMVCFPEDSNEDGFMTWNDQNREHDKHWVTVPVPGKMFWAVPTSEFKLTGTGLMKMFASVIGCEKSCGGIIDTGTSLITPPAEVVNAIQNAVESGDVDSCEDISKFPTLSFKLGEHTFSLPPQSYIAETGVQQVLLEHQYLAMPPLPRTKADALKLKKAKDKGESSVQVNSCTLMLSPNEDSEPTQFGPMVIFGMALFRKYAVQFDLSGDLEDKEHNPKAPTRFMRFAEAEHDCSGTGMDKKARFRRTNTLQKVNLDKIRISPLQQKVMRAPKKGNFLKNMFQRKPILQI